MPTDERHVVYPTKTVEGYVGVVAGVPQFRKSSDNRGDDMKSFDVFQTEAEALNRWHNVRRVTVTVHGDPIYAPDDWGQIDE